MKTLVRFNIYLPNTTPIESTINTTELAKYPTDIDADTMMLTTSPVLIKPNLSSTIPLKTPTNRM